MQQSKMHLTKGVTDVDELRESIPAIELSRWVNGECNDSQHIQEKKRNRQGGAVVEDIATLRKGRAITRFFMLVWWESHQSPRVGRMQ